MNLPINFLKRMKQLLGEEYDSYIRSYNDTINYGLRINTLKISPEDFVSKSPFSLEQVKWVKNGFYYNKKDHPSKHPYYYAGLYYIQEPSAMTPAELMPVNEGDKVLDLCAAPGGKSTQLGAKLKNKGILVSNDISPSRAKGLLKNIELSGITNGLVMSESPSKLTGYFPDYFDKILVDAPCSGEGMFRKEPSMVKNWEQKGVDYYSSIQREILPSAAIMLKPGGYLLYSTCTFAPEENEGTIDGFLKEHQDFELVDLPTYEGFSTGRQEWVNSDYDMSKTVRLWPHRIKGEGHFIALLRKKEGDVPHLEHSYKVQASRRDLEPYLQFERDFLDFRVDTSRLEIINNKLFYMPKDMPQIKGLRLLRTGWYIGEMKNKRFEPSQAFAMGLKSDQFIHRVDFSGEDIQVIKYLKGETLNEKAFNGYNLISVDGFPLGWGKGVKNLIKNKYYSGWRMM